MEKDFLSKAAGERTPSDDPVARDVASSSRSLALTESSFVRAGWAPSPAFAQTLRRYYDNDWEGKAYTLEGVQGRFENRTYEQLESEDSRRLDDSIIHATVVRQDEPSEDMSSIYLVFERLNSGGTILQPQEIRVALYHGELVSLLTDLNSTRAWRALFGRKSRRLKDIELILRFFAMLESSRRYKRPMKGFLNAYMAKRRHVGAKRRDSLTAVFTKTTEAILRGIGSQAFKLKTAVNAALADAVMVGVARRVLAGEIANPDDFKKAYDDLLSDPSFQRIYWSRDGRRRKCQDPSRAGHRAVRGGALKRRGRTCSRRAESR